MAEAVFFTLPLCPASDASGPQGYANATDLRVSSCVRGVCTHVLVQDADLVLVHEQERLVQDKGGWQAAYCMPHGSDAGVLAMRCALASAAARALRTVLRQAQPIRTAANR